MAGDLRHGYGGGHKQTFQRKSQQVNVESEGSSSSRLVWVAAAFLSLGLLLGYFVVYHFATEGVGTRSEAAAKSASLPQMTESNLDLPKVDVAPKNVPVEVAALSAPTTLAESDKKSPLHYSFYDGLSETEVVVDAEPIPITLPVPYYIQAGTFGSEEQAKREQARLRGLGQETEITVYQGKRTYYRLRVGPFEDRLSLNKKRNELKRLGVDTLLVKSVSSASKTAE